MINESLGTLCSALQDRNHAPSFCRDCVLSLRRLVPLFADLRSPYPKVDSNEASLKREKLTIGWIRLHLKSDVHSG